MPVSASRVASSLRLVGVLICSPLQAVGSIAICGSLWYGLALAYVPVAAGWVGLAYRPILDVIADRDPPRYELSAKGAIVSAIGVFAVLLAIAPAHTDRTKLIALFLASGTLYYAFGKLGCIALGCCRATAPFALRIPLPEFEAAGSAIVSALVLASLYGTARLRVAMFLAVALAFGGLRILSRCARGARLQRALLQPDSLVITLVILCATLVLLI